MVKRADSKRRGREFELYKCLNKNAAGEEGKEKPPHKIHFPRKIAEPCLWFLLRSKLSMLWNSMKILLVTKATGNHLIPSTSLENTQSMVSATFEIEYAM